jgi:hypothetical protein
MSNRVPPEKIFISVDQSTGRSTISFAPSDAGAPIQHEEDRTGAHAMKDAKTISDRHPGCTIHGPHFHDARPVGRKRMVRRPPKQDDAGGGGGGDD